MTRNDIWADLLRAGDRRTFLKVCGVLGIGAVGGGVLQSVFKVIPVGVEGTVSETRLAMGTYVTLTAVHSSYDHAEEAIGRAFEEMDRLVAILSRHDSTTPVSFLNREGVLSDPPPELAQMIERSLHFGRLTGGAFDITVQPIIDLLKRSVANDPASAPARADIYAALRLVGAEKIELTSRGLRLGEDGMKVTLDGIAKGYVVDRMSETLSTHGIENHLVNAGGDIRTRGARSKDRPWTVAVEDPDKRRRYPDVIRMTTGAVATSGNYEVYFDNDRVFHHIIDPRRGDSPDHCVSVSVRAATAMEADALSTATFVLGPQEGVQLLNGLEDRECLVVDGEGHEFRSGGWSSA